MFNKIFFVSFACLCFSAHAGDMTTVQLKNDTGRTTIARSIKIEGGEVVFNGCMRFIPPAAQCSVSVRKNAPKGKLTVDFDGTVKTQTF
jgi:ABC-type transport system involved in cytochrome c biogenesis ATPase subunit